MTAIFQLSPFLRSWPMPPISPQDLVSRLKAAVPRLANHRFIYRTGPDDSICLVDIDNPDGRVLRFPAQISPTIMTYLETAMGFLTFMEAVAKEYARLYQRSPTRI